MNNHPSYLAAKNGLIDLKTGTLYNFEARHCITQTLNVDFDPNANTQHIEDFVFEILGSNHENYDYFRWLIGYLLQGIPKRKVLVHLFGHNGNNGKSLLLKLLRKVLGCYSVTMQPSVFQKQNNGANPQILETKNARLGVIFDVSKDTVFHPGTTLSLCGGCDEFSVRGLYDQFTTTFTPTVVPVISSNEYLSLDKKHEALVNRMIIITFPIQFVENPDPNNEFQKKINHNLEDELSTVENQQGLLKYLVNCSGYYHEIGDNMIPTQSMKNQVTKFKENREDGDIDIDF
jgi:putative DNA primase/helicase